MPFNEPMEEPEIEREKKLNLFFVDGDGDTGLAALVGGLELATNVAATGGDGGGGGVGDNQMNDGGFSGGGGNDGNCFNCQQPG